MTEQTQQDPAARKINTNPNKLILAGLLIIVFFFGGLGAWSAFFPFQGAVIASGTVKVSNEKKTVQHLEGGIVDEILVQEGDRVDKGQTLIRLKSSRVIASVSLLRGQLRAKKAEAARLQAESTMEKSIDWPKDLLEVKDQPEVAMILKKQQDIFASRRKDLKGKISLHYSQIEQIKEQIEGIREELLAQKDIIQALKEELSAKKELLQGKYIDKAAILELRRMLAERKGREGRLKQNIAEARQKIEELKLRIVDLRNSYREKAVSRLSEVSDLIFELKEKLRPQVDAQQRLEITAPIAGEVMNLRIHSEESGVIQAGQPILDIVPGQAKLVVEARVRLQDITDVKKGQPTKVQLSAFNRRSTPPVPGEVIYVSADQVSEETSRGVRSYYLAHVRVNPEQLEEYGAYLSPGMPAVCYITTEKRTVLGYLLEPILGIVDQAMREG
ncbi:MAG: HlyD family type I secretion periplasmic adaptor subunit [Desulfohalobiaceae bacterium]|nr:HlyD family type I secretion periplasmic adaptor subunit [Desulfohalobiaceae bacterium]